MATVLTRGTELFPHEIVSEVFSKVKGHSSLAKLAGTTPVSFAGTDIFTFALDSEANIVAESGQKTNGGATVASIKMQPIKIEYGARVTDEFLKTSEEKQLNMLGAFVDGYSVKIARALDIMGMHGFNPRTGTASTLIGTNSLGTAVGVNSVTFNASDIETGIIDAISACGEYVADGIAMSKTFATAVAKAKDGQGHRIFPELGFGQSISNLRGLAADVNSTVSYQVATTGDANDKLAIVGDFAECFKWGFAEDIPMEVIEYGDPDGNGDLKRLNQIFLRAEAYIGWAILDPTAFAIIKSDT